MVRIPGKNTVPARTACPELRRGCSTDRTHVAVRTRLLFGDLPAGRDAGCGFVDRGKTNEKPVPLLTGPLVVAVRCARAFHRSRRGRNRLFRRTAGTLQRLRAHCLESHRTAVPLGQQPARLPGRTGRQLCVLQGRRMDEGNRHAGRSGRDIHYFSSSGMA